MTTNTYDPTLAGAVEADVPAPPADTTTGGEPAEPKRRRRMLGILFAGLLVLFLAFLSFTGWYLINRKPVSQLPIPGVSVEPIPHYAFSAYGVQAPTGVAVNADGSRIYATQTEKDPKVLVFDGTGKTIASIVPPPTAAGSHVPVYVAVDPANGDVYVSDRPAASIYVYSADGIYRRTFDPGKALVGWQPLGMSFDRSGNLWVTDVGNGNVHEFAPDGSFMRTIGAPGTFSFPNGVAVDAAGYIYIADSNNGRVIVYTPDGTQKSLIPRGAGAGELGIPRGIAIDDQGRVYVVDVSAHEVQLYHQLGADRVPKYIGHAGTRGSTDGAFLFPNGVAVDGRGRVYVADWRNNRIQVWSY